MVKSRREYLIAAFVISVLSVCLIIASLASDRWVVSEADGGELSFGASYINYGLFSGELVLGYLQTATSSPLHMTCVIEAGACAPSCKTSEEARKNEVIAMAEGRTPSLPCAAVTIVDVSQPLRDPSVISYWLYVAVLTVLAVHLVSALLAAALAALNVFRNPTEPLLGVSGVQWSNALCGLLGLTVLMTWGVYWAATDLHSHLAVAYTALGELLPVNAALGHSYWILLASTLGACLNMALVEVRRWHLERDPAPPTITIENHSDGTVFLY